MGKPNPQAAEIQNLVRDQHTSLRKIKQQEAAAADDELQGWAPLEFSPIEPEPEPEIKKPITKPGSFGHATNQVHFQLFAFPMIRRITLLRVILSEGPLGVFLTNRPLGGRSIYPPEVRCSLTRCAYRQVTLIPRLYHLYIKSVD